MKKIIFLITFCFLSCTSIEYMYNELEKNNSTSSSNISSINSSQISSQTSSVSSSEFSSLYNKPYIEIINLNNLDILSITNYTYYGKVTNNIGINYVYFWLEESPFTNKIDIYGLQSSIWYVNINNLKEGTNIVKFYAIDIQSNLSEIKSLTNIIDITAPYISFIYPNNNSIISAGNIEIIITNSDNISGIKSLVLLINDVIITTLSYPNTIITQNLTSLNDGTNIIKIIAYDNANNSNEVSINIIYDKTIPTISILNINNYMITNITNINISGSFTVWEFDSLNDISIKINNNNFSSVNYDNNNKTWWTNDVLLTANFTNLIIARITTTNNRTNYTSNFIIVDLLPPIITLNMPTNNQVFNTNYININGIASDNISGVKEVWLSIGNSSSFNKFYGISNFNTNIISSQEGTNILYVFSKDNCGNISSTNSINFLIALNIYVSTNGDDLNDGITKSSPIKSIQLGLTKALNYSVKNIYLTSGIYTPGKGLNNLNSGIMITNNNINIIGGWDNSFSSIDGLSELDGNNILYHIVYAQNVNNIILNNLILRNGIANLIPNDRDGGGLYLNNVSYSQFSNLVISNNKSSLRGGGVFINNSHDLYFNITICYNNSRDGAGIYLTSGYNNIIKCDLYNNIASRDGGGIYLFGDYYTINANIYNNIATNSGGGIYINNSKNTLILSSFITNNIGVGINSVINLNYSINLSNLIISNCYISGSSNSIGIYEGGTVDTTEHILLDNIFITNNLLYLYNDFVNGLTNDINAINDIKYSGAIIANNNIIMNM